MIEGDTMQTYICKCGKTFNKSSNAESTGYVLKDYSPQHECYGCPYIVVERDWKTKEIIKRECRATPQITYLTQCYIGTDGGDFSACYVYSLDLVFVKRVLNYVNSLEGAEKHDHAIPEEWRAADFGQCYRSSDCYGLCTFHLYFKNNKTGTEARRDVMRRFFDDYGYGRGIRKEMTKDKEKEIIMQRIEIAKENARAKLGIPELNKTEETKMKFDIGSMINAPTSENGALTVKDIPIDMLVPYHKHPFVLYSGERLDDMVNSVKTNGILTPIITRTLPDGKYEILAGHNRTNAAKLAGLTTVPAVVKESLSDEEAEMYVIETNAMQRGFKELRISEQAAVVALRHTKMFDEEKQKAISDELLALDGEGSKQSKLAAVGEEYNLSKNTIARLIRVHKLLEACEKYTESVDTGNLSIRAAVELSYIHSSALEIIFERYCDNVVVNNVWCDIIKIDVNFAAQLRELFKSFNGTKRTAELMIDTMQKCEDMPKKKKPVKLDPNVRTKYFSDDESDDYVNSIIAKALEMYFDNNEEVQNKL